MKKLKVVTSFLIYSDKLLILKRSNKVPMCGLWSAISGRLEKYEQPLQRAKIEILEEVGLTNEQVKLLKIPLTLFSCILYVSNLYLNSLNHLSEF